MNISQAAKASELSVKTVRYYADTELVAPQGRTEAGYRVYGDREIRKLIFVRRARTFGFGMAECRDLLALYEDQDRSSADVKAIARSKLEQIERKMEELQSLRDDLAFVVQACRGDDRPDCPIIDYFG